MLIFLFFLNCFLNVGYNSTHDFHLSRCEVNYETKTGELQIAAHIFIDDLENAIAATSVKGLNIATAKESKNADEEIEKYINKHLVFKHKGKKLNLKMLGKETSTDLIAVWCYLEASNIVNLKELEVENTILIEIFNDQKNLIDFTVNKKKKHFTIFDQKKIKALYTTD